METMRHTDLQRRRLCIAVGGAIAGGPGAARAEAERFPVRALRIVVPYSVGLGPDIVARTVGDWLAQHWGRPVVIDNRPGAAGIIAFSELRRTAPDGHTLFIADTGTLAVNPLIYRALPYDPARDVAPISLLFRATFLLLVSGRSRFGSVAELLAAARREPGRVTYASLGNGHPSQVAVETLANAADVRLMHVGFKEAGALFSAVANNEVDFTTFSYNSTAGLIRAGRIRALAVAARQRLKEAPDIPTLVEVGGPPVELRPWAGLVTVAGTPVALLQTIQGAVAEALAAATVRSRIEGAGFEVTPSTPREMTALVQADTALYTTLVRQGRVRQD
jgi:tripartite-type tricarboxylate transporter receptor subunit TctC